MLSTAYIQSGGRTLRFSGVLSVRHTQTLKLSSGGDAESDADVINGARCQPARITLEIAETDVTSAGRSREVLARLCAMRESRALCRVHTGLQTCERMLLTELTAARDEETPCGFTATLVFTEAPAAESAANPERHIGLTGARQVSGEEARELFARAGIQLKEGSP